MEVDPGFTRSARQARSRRRRRLAGRIAGAGGGLGLLAGIWFGVQAAFSPFTAVPDDDAPEMVQVEVEGGDAPPPLADRAALVRLRGDPLILRLAEGEVAEGPRTLTAPQSLAARIGAGPVGVITGPLLTQAARLATALPSSRDDFALFQAQRAEGLASLLGEEGGDVAAEPGVELIGKAAEEAAGSWGAPLETGETIQAVAFTQTAIENTTSVVTVLPEARRTALFEDGVVVVRVPQSLESLLAANGLSEEDAARAVAGIGRVGGLNGGDSALPLDALPVGSVVGLRLAEGRLLQMSLYGPAGYAFTVAQIGAGRFAAAADPWLDDDLMGRSTDLRRDAEATRDVRLLDAVWGTALRGGLPGAATGELLVMMSKRFDLDRNAQVGDRLVLLFGPGEGAGSILYAGVEGPSGPMACFVVPVGSGFGCFDPDATVSVGAGLSASMVTPVAGTRTSGFGPRMHPILKQLRNHDGLDWAAPTGTPVVAAMAGKVAVMGPGGGYGNVVYLDHAGGVQTRYAHLDRFAEGLAAGASVAAGDRIGYVGTTGRSTGPHLHFEIRVAGAAIDPLTYAESGSDDGAVDALVNRIVQVESGGSATAKNPLSSATGLGQFIEGTWIRMMRSYRPDLAGAMDRTALLALRNDPALSREMVRNLARESENYLRVRGHSITAGRLYLAHFLGAEGADRSLRADPALPVLTVMGAGVVGANPFLRGMTNADMQTWAERKMSGRGAAVVAASRPAPVSAEVTAFLEGVGELLGKL